MTGTRKLHSSTKTFKVANIRKPGPKITTLPVAGGTVNSTWEETPDFQKIVGICFTATSASSIVPITSASVGDKFYITGSDDTIYTFSASLDATASMNMEITSASLGDKFYISGSDGTVYTYSASMDVTASLDMIITSASLGAAFFITSSGGTIYTFSASLDATASLSVSITSASLGDEFFITSSGGTIYTYSASGGPIPSDANPIFYFGTGSDLAGSVANLKDEINISYMSGSLTASVVTSTLILRAKNTGSAGNLIGFQSGSTQNLFTGGLAKPVDVDPIFYFDIGQGIVSLATTVENLKEEVNKSTVSSFVTASVTTTSMSLFATTIGSIGNSIGFQSGSTQNLLTGGTSKPVDSYIDYIYYFDLGSGAAINTTVTNLKDEINNSDVNASVTGSTITNTLYLWTKNPAVSGSWSFISGSTRDWFVGGDIVSADSGNVFYFDIGVGGVLATASLNLKDEINNSTANAFITASIDTNTLNLYTTVADSIGIAVMGFQSGSTQYKILQSDSGSNGTLYIQQAPFTSSADYSGSAITIGDSNGMEFSQDLYSGYVRLKYVQTGSIAPNFLRIYTYLVP